MAIPESTGRQLRALVDEVRRGIVSDQVPTIAVARRLGLRVWLRRRQRASDGIGRLVFGSTPHITISRPHADLKDYELFEEDERALSQRERFTMCHEIGHWLAFDRFGIAPEAEGSDYWRDEDVINKFAAELLIPDRMLESWLSQIGSSNALKAGQLISWCAHANASRPAVAKRVCDNRDQIGFAALEPSSNSKGEPRLRVEFSAGGRGVQLPGRTSLIQNPDLISMLTSKSTGVETLNDFRFKASRFLPPQTLQLSWVTVPGSELTEDADGVQFITAWWRDGSYLPLMGNET